MSIYVWGEHYWRRSGTGRVLRALVDRLALDGQSVELLVPSDTEPELLPSSADVPQLRLGLTARRCRWFGMANQAHRVLPASTREGVVFTGGPWMLRPIDGKTVATIHDLFPLEVGGPLAALYRFQVRLCMRYADLVTTPSAWTAFRLASEIPVYAERSAAVLIPWTSRTEAASNVTKSVVQVLIVGSQEPRRNLLAQVYAVYLLGLRFPAIEFRVTIVGSAGSSSKSLNWLIDALDIRSRTVLLYSTPDSVLDHLYRQADVLLAVSIEEGSGLPGLEMRERGGPVVWSDSTGPEQDPTGIYSSPSPLAIRDALEQVLRQHGMVELDALFSGTVVFDVGPLAKALVQLVER